MEERKEKWIEAIKESGKEWIAKKKRREQGIGK